MCQKDIGEKEQIIGMCQKGKGRGAQEPGTLILHTQRWKEYEYTTPPMKHGRACWVKFPRFVMRGNGETRRNISWIVDLVNFLYVAEWETFQTRGVKLTPQFFIILKKKKNSLKPNFSDRQTPKITKFRFAAKPLSLSRSPLFLTGKLATLMFWDGGRGGSHLSQFLSSHLADGCILLYKDLFNS